MIPVNEPLLGEAELANVIDCVKSGWISSAGSYIEEFERAWACECGVRHGVAVSNGTTALQIAVVTAVLSDVDGETHVAVVLADDPAADLHDWYGRYWYFAPDELEPLPAEVGP